MFCVNCGQKLNSSEKFCTSCGVLASNAQEEFASLSAPRKSGSIGKIITIVIIIAAVGFGVYSALDEDAVAQNNEGLTNFDSGDSQTAIRQLEQAFQEAVTNETKINTLKNAAMSR